MYDTSCLANMQFKERMLDYVLSASARACQRVASEAASVMVSADTIHKPVQCCVPSSAGRVCLQRTRPAARLRRA